MAKSTHVITKTPKKRAAVTGDLVGVRVQPDMAKSLDDWRRKQDDLPGRPEAIRRLVEVGLLSSTNSPDLRYHAKANESAAKAKSLRTN
jgi:hypothetical protein